MRKKLYRFSANALQPNIIEAGKPIYTSIKGNWHNYYFENKHDITVELGCGYGDYTIGLGEQFSDKNFIGVDIKGARIWQGSQNAAMHQLKNIAFLRTRIEQLDQFFGKEEISELYIPFPDPRPKGKDAKRRLTSPRFLALYRKLLKKGGAIHLKTDSDFLFFYTLEVLDKQNVRHLIHTEDLYSSELLAGHEGVQTIYEKKFLLAGTKIKYLRFEFALDP